MTTSRLLLVASAALVLAAIPQVAASGGGFDSGNLESGRSFSFTFTDVGTFTYHCNIHSSMKGKIIVTSDSGSGTHPIDVQGSAFPAEFTISKGVTVTWTNRDSFAHTVTSDTQGNVAGKAAPGLGAAWVIALASVAAALVARPRR